MRRIIVATVAIILGACECFGMSAGAATKVIRQKRIIRCVGQKLTMRISSAKGQKIVWKSSNKQVATVKKGIITAKKVGKAKITARVKGSKYICPIVVKKHSYSRLDESQNICYNCGKTKKRTVQVTNDSYDQWNTDTYQEYQDTETDNHIHEYCDASCTQASVCTICNQLQWEAWGHDYEGADCEETLTCRRCDEQTANPNKKDHDWKYYDTEIGICGGEDTQVYYCTECYAKDEKKIASEYQDHTYKETRSPATNTQQGYTVHTCTHCKDSYIDGYHNGPKQVLISRDATGYLTGAKAVFEAAFRAVDSVVNAGMSDEQKVQAIHDYLIYHADYYNNGDVSNVSNWAYSAQGVLLRGEGVCQSYAIAFYMMCTAVGIPCEYVTGTAVNSKGRAAHGWNRVYVNNKWYYVDCTWDDPVGWKETQKYVMSETLWSSHTQEKTEDIGLKNSVYWENYYLTGYNY
jgi:hypothetical protein